MKKNIRPLTYLYFAFFGMLLLSRTVNAYIDPATASYIIQITAAFFITIGVLLSALSTRVKLFFTKIKMQLIKEYYTRRAVTNDIEEGEPKSGTVASLWYDKRSFFSRLVLALVSSLALTFTFIVFGCYDLIIANREMLVFSLQDVWRPILLVGLISFISLTLLFLLLKGKVFNTVISLSVGILIAGYVQGNFLNLKLGQLTGNAIMWQNYKGHMLLNTFIWIAIISVPLIISYFSKIIWKFFCHALPIMLVLVQLISLVVLLFNTDNIPQIKRDGYLSVDGIYEFSQKDNIIVIVLDRLDEYYINEIVEENPHYFDDFDGFTRYTNNMNYYCRTYPSVINMLTGKVTFYDIPADKFATNAYKESTFISDIRDKGYTTKFYMEKRYTYTDIWQLSDLADNAAFEQIIINKDLAVKRVLELAAYRYVPHVMKPSFWLSTADFSDAVEKSETEPLYITDDYTFFTDLKEQGVQLQYDKGNFVYYHLNGAHAPLMINEKIEAVPESETTTLKQTKGCFNIVREMISQLKENGLYNDACIIVTGDHGISTDIREVDRAILTGLFVKRKGEYGTALKTNNAPVNSDNLRGSVLKTIGADNSENPPAYWEVDENSDVVRKYYYRLNGKGGKDYGYLEEFEVYGDGRDFNNWKKVRNIPIKHPYA
ncbi:MAG TPA: sulfatase-like hydrolase/transferase [Clostridia bacterium]|nr:sulfatase-like hydrolase/transferase [Clostridia bacterium]